MSLLRMNQSGLGTHKVRGETGASSVLVKIAVIVWLQPVVLEA